MFADTKYSSDVIRFSRWPVHIHLYSYRVEYTKTPIGGFSYQSRLTAVHKIVTSPLILLPAVFKNRI